LSALAIFRPLARASARSFSARARSSGVNISPPKSNRQEIARRDHYRACHQASDHVVDHNTKAASDLLIGPTHWPGLPDVEQAETGKGQDKGGEGDMRDRRHLAEREQTGRT